MNAFFSQAPASLRARLLWGILPPIAAFIALNTYSLYHKALEVADIAYDRTLLATAKTIGEQISVTGYDEAASLQASITYSSLEAFENDNFSNLFYKVTDTQGRFVSGYADLETWQGRIPQKPRYAALVEFYNAQYNGQAVRIAVLLQPIANEAGRAMAVIQVAETLELRQALAREILSDTVMRQMLLLLLIAAVVLVVVQAATRPLRQLRQTILERDSSDHSAIDVSKLSTELRPVVEASNSVMTKLQSLSRHQKRFVRDTAHQLRTPLAVLTTQLQSGLRGDAPPLQIMSEMERTVKAATALANQMLNLAKVEQLKHQAPVEDSNWADIVRDMALELSPLIVEKHLQFDMQVDAANQVLVRAHPWMLRELSRNLIHNAIKFTPNGQVLSIAMQLSPPSGQGQSRVQLGVKNSALQPLPTTLLNPANEQNQFTGTPNGLGLLICHEIVQSLGGTIHVASHPHDSMYFIEVKVSMNSV